MQFSADNKPTFVFKPLLNALGIQNSSKWILTDSIIVSWVYLYHILNVVQV